VPAVARSGAACRGVAAVGRTRLPDLGMKNLE
jgi:hypothetical protein